MCVRVVGERIKGRGSDCKKEKEEREVEGPEHENKKDREAATNAGGGNKENQGKP